MSPIPPKVLDDLCSRFVINIPPEQRNDHVRVLFAIELAHWFYLDFYCEDFNDLRACSLRDFAEQIFLHCPFLRDHVYEFEAILSKWRGFKSSVPTYGGILLDPTYEHVLLVQGFYNRESWGFPKGKVQENEIPLHCAIREVMEEVGFDIKDRASDNTYIERLLNGQLIRLYIIANVPLDTRFCAKTKNEIKDVRWFRLADLPCHKRDMTPKTNLDLSPKAFFMVIPFIKDLRRWIAQEQGLHSSSNGLHTSDSDNANEYTHSLHHHQSQNRPTQQNCNMSTSQLATNQRRKYDSGVKPISLQQLFETEHTRHNKSYPLSDFQNNYYQRRNSTKIIADLTGHQYQITQNMRKSRTKTNENQVIIDQSPIKQPTIQDTIQQHFCKILKNDSLTVTDNTNIAQTINEALLSDMNNTNKTVKLNHSMSTPATTTTREIKTTILLATSTSTIQKTTNNIVQNKNGEKRVSGTPTSNEEGNSSPTKSSSIINSFNRNEDHNNLGGKHKKMSHHHHQKSNQPQVQYTILKKNQPNEPTRNLSSKKFSRHNPSEQQNNVENQQDDQIKQTDYDLQNRRRTDRRLQITNNSQQLDRSSSSKYPNTRTNVTIPFSNLTNNSNDNQQKQSTYSRRYYPQNNHSHQQKQFFGPRCWTNFRFNRHEILRCL
ncbi:unnamed protein product [Didymodactylos carnosus]|uniref:m7GpppN-mRNA hydrolase n=1 Tax=Didymodactylos carnosus TaxID=1234261 RepID=A0A814DPP2_9BILA|nr:unnamed protein product [Didymodactylos carnosus]CAF0957810.1 unnamed protein product [Didymodactylos carnosus]CAF3723424.1 unnamed protein product [Didymodactylos carnosus]CAF3732609.1 unnamed protein product [Didymodactylos carnosus]